MSQSHYSLRWNNHQSHILSAFDALLQAETLVDVTLVCAETSVRAHKVVLSACSPFFQRIFAENPCKHPVIVLKDFSGWEVQAIVDFMYKGEVSVVQEQLQSLIKAAESLQVRGLVNQDELLAGEAPAANTPVVPLLEEDDVPSASTSSVDFETTRGNAFYMSPLGSAMNTFASPNEPQRVESPLPRRKQARPRRRSGEICTPQDLSTCAKPASSPAETPATPPPPPQQHVENLSLKKPKLERSHVGGESPAPKDRENKDKENIRQLEELKDKKAKMTFQGQFIQQSLLPLQNHLHHFQHYAEEDRSKLLTPDPSGSPELDLSVPHQKEYPPSPPLLPSMINLKHELDGHSPLPFPPIPSVSALTMTPPHSKFFGLDSPLLFPPGLDRCRNPLLELADPRSNPDTQMFTKKKMGRPKGQHSAPRGGPPRSWTNAELTEALQHVWNKKMTTSQASRIFGIPYNSLLMYVRGKYGKSLKLEQLRKDCIGAPAAIDLMNLAGAPPSSAAVAANNNNNNNNSKASDEGMQRPSSTEQPPLQSHAVFNPFAPNFYPDFGAGGFPIPVSMIHLLPQSEKNRDHYGGPPGVDLDECNKSDRSTVKDEPQDLFLPPSLSREDRRELVRQNGQD